MREAITKLDEVYQWPLDIREAPKPYWNELIQILDFRPSDAQISLADAICWLTAPWFDASLFRLEELAR